MKKDIYTNIREVDALIQVIRNFANDDIIHVQGKINPLHDKEIINLELILTDLETLVKHLEKINNKQWLFIVTSLFGIILLSIRKSVNYKNKFYQG